MKRTVAPITGSPVMLLVTRPSMEPASAEPRNKLLHSRPTSFILVLRRGAIDAINHNDRHRLLALLECKSETRKRVKDVGADLGVARRHNEVEIVSAGEAGAVEYGQVDQARSH